MIDRSPHGTVYQISGRGASTAVLIHGLGLNRHSWQWQVPALAGSYRVITYDLLGHGESTLPPEAPSLSLFSWQLLELLDHLGIQRAAVLGFSLGGMIARRFAMDHPDRLWALGILHSAHVRDQAAHDNIQARVMQVRREGPTATVEAALQRWFTGRFRTEHPAMMDDLRRWIMANPKEVYAQIYQVLVDGVNEIAAPQPPITAPTLVMTGGEDHGNSPAMSRAIAAEIPGSVVEILPGLRHMAMAENPELFNARLMAFLASARHTTEPPPNLLQRRNRPDGMP